MHKRSIKRTVSQCWGTVVKSLSSTLVRASDLFQPLRLSSIMEPIFILSSTTYALIAILAVVVTTIIIDYFRNKRLVADMMSKEGLKELPGPWAWPVIGNLHLMGGYEVPYQAFGVLAQRFGKVFRLELGSQTCVVVNGLDNIREVLMSKATHFDGRPNFRRYHQLFCGDKENCK